MFTKLVSEYRFDPSENPESAIFDLMHYGGSGVVVQISDRLPAWLDHAFGLDKHAAEGITKATSLCTCLEEGGEMMIAIFALLTIYLGYRAVRAAEEAPSAR